MLRFRRDAPEEREPTDPARFAELEYPLIQAPFFGEAVLVKVRILTQAQILSVGDFSMIETFADKIEMKRRQKKLKMSDVVAYAELQHSLCRASLVAPTYEQIFEVCSIDGSVETKRKELDEILSTLATTPTSKDRSQLEQRAMELKVWVDLILPTDFLSTVVGYALDMHRSDIKQVTEEMLIQAAVLAELGHDNPADHIEGRFTAFNRDDINTRAWRLWHERKKEMRGKRPEAKRGR